MSYDWMDSALCAQADPDVWFPEGSGGSLSIAKRICARCPVRQHCVDHAQRLEGELAHRYRHGTWGGAAPRGRANTATGNRKRQAAEARDTEIIRLDAAGRDAAEIASRVGCTERTVFRTLAAQRQYREAA